MLVRRSQDKLPDPLGCPSLSTRPGVCDVQGEACPEGNRVSRRLGDSTISTQHPSGTDQTSACCRTLLSDLPNDLPDKPCHPLLLQIPRLLPTAGHPLSAAATLCHAPMPLCCLQARASPPQAVVCCQSCFLLKRCKYTWSYMSQPNESTEGARRRFWKSSVQAICSRKCAVESGQGKVTAKVCGRCHGRTSPIPATARNAHCGPPSTWKAGCGAEGTTLMCSDVAWNSTRWSSPRGITLAPHGRSVSLTHRSPSCEHEMLVRVYSWF